MRTPHAVGPVRRPEVAAVAAAAVFVGLLAASAAWAGGEEVVRHLGRIGPSALLGLLALSLLNYTVRALRWHMFSRHLALPVPLSRSGLYYVGGFAMTTTPGKAGEALRLWFLERGHGCRYERTAALLVGDRLSDLTAIVLLCLLGVAAFSHLWPTLAAAALLGATIWVVLRPAPLLRLLLLGYGRVGRWPRLFARGRVLLRESAALTGSWVYGAALVPAMVGWFAECLALYWLLVQLGADVGVRQAVFVFTFSMLVGGLSMLPGGLGGTEATMLGLLVVLGVEAGVAVAATAVIRATTLWFAVGLGFLALPWALHLARRGPSVTATPITGS